MIPNKFLISNAGGAPPPQPVTDFGYIVAAPYATGGNIFISEDLGQTWRTTNIPSANNSFFTAVIRGDVILINRLGGSASYPHYSLDRGYTFSNAPFTKNYPNSAAISQDKQILLFSGDGNPKTLIMSLDGGVTWFQQATGAVRQYGVSVGDAGRFIWLGQYSSSGFRYTDDYRTTWSTVQTAAKIYDLDISSDGKYIYGGDYSYSGRVWVSHDFGASWVYKTITGLGKSVRVKCSDDGKYVIAHSGNTSFSHDYGLTWTPSFTPGYGSYTSWNKNISPSGKYMILGSSTGTYGQYFISEDFGLTWTAKVIPNFGSYYPNAISIC